MDSIARICGVEGCGNKHKGLGYCEKHYIRFKKYGDPLFCMFPEIPTYSWKTREYSSWMSMKTRCNNPNSLDYKDYGERGIKICQRWQESFKNFLEDMGRRPKNMTLNRIDNNLGYYPKNCEWASLTEQVRNRRLNKSNTSGYSGVRYIKSSNNWRVQIKCNSMRIHLGMFTNKQDAINARKRAEKKYWGKSM